DLPLRGAAAIAEHAERLWDGFPDVRLERTGARLTDGTYVAVPCRLLGTHRRSFAGVPATGRSITVHGVFYCQAEHGRLVPVRGFLASYAASGQLGRLPGGRTLGERALLLLRGFGLRARGGPGRRGREARKARRYLVTTIVPVIPGWIVHTYWIVPALVSF